MISWCCWNPTINSDRSRAKSAFVRAAELQLRNYKLARAGLPVRVPGQWLLRSWLT